MREVFAQFGDRPPIARCWSRAKAVPARRWSRAIHRLSRRCDHRCWPAIARPWRPRPWKAVVRARQGFVLRGDCHQKGLFEVAHHGTLFLDEVANLSQETQGKLLRVLETRRVRKVGDTAEYEVVSA